MSDPFKNPLNRYGGSDNDSSDDEEELDLRDYYDATGLPPSAANVSQTMPSDDEVGPEYRSILLDGHLGFDPLRNITHQDFKEDFGGGGGSVSSSSYIIPLPKFIPYVSIPRSGWTENAQVVQVPPYHPYDMMRCELGIGLLEDAKENIRECNIVLSIQAHYIDDPLSAALLTKEGVELYLSVWLTRKGDTVVVEVQRRKGDAIVANGYAHQLLLAAQGKFAKDCFLCDTAVDMTKLASIEAAVRQAVSSGPVKDASETQQINLAINVAQGFLASPRMDARALGLESLCVHTDPRKTSIDAAVAVCVAVLFGTNVQMQHDPTCAFIHKTILSLVILRSFGDETPSDEDDDASDFIDSDVENFFPSDDEGASKSSGEYSEYMSHMFYLALTVFVNAIETIGSFQNHRYLQGRNISDMAMTLLVQAREHTSEDLILTLLDCVSKAERKQHSAALSTKALRFLCAASQKIKEGVLLSKNTGHCLSKAYHIGKDKHSLLEKESEQLWVLLST